MRMDLKEYEQLKNGRATTFCDECKKEWYTNETKIEVTSCKVEGEEIDIQYFRCPHCGKSYAIKIDNERSRQLTFQFMQIHSLLESKRDRGKKIPKSKVTELKKKETQLRLRHAENKLSYIDYLPV